MDPERWRRVEDLFFQAADLEAGPRTAFLEKECGQDPELMQAVRKLLGQDERSEDWAKDLVTLPWSAEDDRMVGTELGVYRLTERVAVGGMGLVYRAERTDGVFQQEVAVKLLRADMATEETRRRFELERSTLAAMNHPNIARLLDGGRTSDGTPYLVMEFIRGVPLDRHCEEQALDLRGRLGLFLTVCRTVHFAHQNLIVHRDLKPGNILVDEHGQVKLLDFGIARLLEADGDSPQPRTVARVLTPEYASPEQLLGQSLTTVSDVYSLGVVLYELLTGSRPFGAESRSAAEWERLVTEQAPTRPSARATLPRLQRQLRGDLDRIVLKTLHKEPVRRYASAQELADDVERFLAGGVVRARPDSWWYRTQRFVARNRMAVGSAVLILGALLYGSITAVRSEHRASKEADHAGIEAESFRTMTGFVMEAFLAVDEFHRQDLLEPMRQTLQRQAEQVRRQFQESRHLRANLLDGLASVCLRVSLFAEAEELAQEALEMRKETFGERHLEVALSMATLGEIEYRRGAFDRAAEYFSQALDLQRTLTEDVHTDVATAANNLAVALRNLGRLDDAKELHQEALARRRARGQRTAPVAESLNNLAGIHLGREDYDQAAALLEEALDIRRASFGDLHPLTLQTLSNLATTRWRQGRGEDAVILLDQAEEGYRNLHESGRTALAQTLTVRAGMAWAQEDLEQAAASYEEAVGIFRDQLGPEHPRLVQLHTQLARVREAQGRFDLARTSLAETIRILETSESRAGLSAPLRDFGLFLLRAREPKAAEEMLRRSLQLLETDLDPGAGELGATLVALGRCLRDQQRPDEARQAWERAAEILRTESSAGDLQKELIQLLASVPPDGAADDS